MLEQSVVEIEVYVQAVLVKAMEEGKHVQHLCGRDAKTFPASEFRGKVHGITAGYPCQPFSSAGKRKGEKTQDTCGPTSEAMSGQLELLVLFPRMSEVTPRWGYGESCPIFEEDGLENGVIVLSGGNRRASPTHPMLHPGLPRVRGITRVDIRGAE